MSEPLLKLAEALGYKVLSECVDGYVAVNKNEGGCWGFDPLNNAEQCLEIMEYFKITPCPVSKTEWAARGQFQTIAPRGKTIQSAVLACALEIIKPPIER